MILELTLVAAASAGTSAWHHLHHRHREIRNHQELCNHQWGPAEEVGRPGMYGPRTRFWIRECPACRDQMHCNEDGSKYIPRSERRDEDK